LTIYKAYPGKMINEAGVHLYISGFIDWNKWRRIDKAIMSTGKHSLLSKHSAGQHPAQSSLAEVQRAWYTWQDCFFGLHICQQNSWSYVTKLVTKSIYQSWTPSLICTTKPLKVILKKVIHNKTFKVLKGLLLHANESISIKAFR
jgi:hypothetical protein